MNSRSYLVEIVAVNSVETLNVLVTDLLYGAETKHEWMWLDNTEVRSEHRDTVEWRELPPLELVESDIETVVFVVVNHLGMHGRVEHDLFRDTTHVYLKTKNKIARKVKVLGMHEWFKK